MTRDEAVMLRRTLSSRAWRALYAVGQIGRDGWPVSVREVQRYDDFASPQTVHAALMELEELGLAETNPRWPSRRSGWRLTDAGYLTLNT